MESQSIPAKLPFWSKLSKEEKASAQRGLTQHTYEKGAYILGFSDACLGMVYIQKGSIGDQAPELCPVCKVPAWKFEKVEGRV